MTKRRPQRAILAGVAALTLVASCSAPSEELESLELTGVDLVAERSAWVSDTAKVEFTVAERFGNASDGESFGRIATVSADPSGRLAVFDAADCSVTLLSADRSARVRFGRCGDGPGELRGIVSMAFREGELLLLSDAMLQRFVVSGAETARINLTERGLGGAAGVVVVDDSTVLIAPGITGNDRDSVRASMLVALNDRTGEVLRRAVHPPPISARNPEARGDFLEICGGRSSGQHVVVLAQAWALQTVVLESTSLSAVSNSVTSSEWTGGVFPDVPGRAQPSLRPRLRAHAVQCLEFGTATWGRTTDWTRVPPVNSGSLLEIRSWTGRVLYRGGNPAAIPPNARPAAAWGDRLVYFSNEGVPEVMVVAITPRSSASWNE